MRTLLIALLWRAAALALLLWPAPMPANNFTAAAAFSLNPALSAYPYETLVTEDVNNASVVGGYIADNVVSFSIYNGGASQYFWDFGDGDTDTTSTPTTTHTYAGAGTYTVSVQVGVGGPTTTSTVTTFIGGVDTNPANDWAVWFSYTPRAGESVIGLQAYAESGGNYRPFIDLFDADGVTAYHQDILNASSVQAGHNQPLQTPTFPGETILIRVTADAFSVQPFADLKLFVQTGPQILAATGSVFVPDDNGGSFPGAVISEDGTSVQYRQTVNGEEADVLPSGIFAIYSDDETVHEVVIYSPQMVELARVALFPTEGGQNSIRSDGVHTFYVSHRKSGDAFTTVKTVSDAGIVGPDTWVLPSVVTTITPSQDGTILYYSNGAAGGPTGGPSNPIKRWDLVNDVALSDFVAAVATHYVAADMFVMADGNILALYGDDGTEDYFARVLSPAGATILDIPFTLFSSPLQAGPRIALGSDDPDSFWVWATSAIGVGEYMSRFVHFRTSDGASLQIIDRPVAEEGVGVAGAGNDPDVPVFGNSFSCPLLILREPLTPLLELPAATPTIDNSAPCCADTSTKTSPCTTEAPVVLDKFYKRCAGGGTVPTAADVTDSEDWADEFPPKEPDSWLTIQPAASEGEWKIGRKPLSDEGRFIEGRLEELSAIERRSSDKDGHYPPARVRVVARDDDGVFRGRLGDDTIGQFINREARIDLLSYAGRKAGLDPVRQLQGRIVDVQPALDRKAVIELQDVMGSQYGALDPEKMIGLPIGAEHPALPVATKGKTYPIILGEWSDGGRTNAQGEDISRGVLPAYDCGDSFRADPSDPGGDVTPDPNGNTFGDAAPIINRAIVNLVGSGDITSPIWMTAAPLTGGVIGQFATPLELDPNGNGDGGPSDAHAARYLFDEPAVPGTEYLVLLYQNPAFNPVTNPTVDQNVRYKIVTAVSPDYPLHPEDSSLWGGYADFTSLTDGAQWGVQTTSAPQNLSYSIIGAGGTTTWIYDVSGITAFGETLPSETLVITDGPAVLDDTNKIFLDWDDPNDNPDAIIDYRVRGRTAATPNQSLGLTGGATEFTDNGTAVPEEFNPCAEGTAVASENVWAWMVCALGTVDVHEIYGSDVAENDAPARTQLSPMGGYIDGPYVREVGGIEQTGFWARGPVLNHHRQGLVTFAWNGCGYDGENGEVIDQAFLMLQTVLNEFVEKNDGEGFRAGAFGPVETFSDGIPKFWTGQFQAAQDQTATWLGTDLGYIGAMAILAPTALSEFLRQFFVTFGGHGTTNHWGQWYPYLINPEPAEGDGRIYRERLEIARLLDHRLAHDETENRVTYRYLLDPDADEWRASPAPVSDALSIASRGGDKIGVAESGLKDCPFGNDLATMTDRWSRHLTLYARPPRYVQWATNLKSLPDHNGVAARFSHRKEGLGVSGEVGTPGVIMHTSVSLQPYEVVQTAMLFRTAIAENQLVSDDTGDSLITDDTGEPLLMDT